MLDLLRRLCGCDRRKNAVLVQVDRRRRMTSNEARRQLDASLDRFQQTIIRRRDQLMK